MKRYILGVILAIGLATSVLAVEGDHVIVTITGVLQEDKNGYYIHTDGAFYDLVISEESKADMHKFHTALEGDLVRVVGSLHVQDVPNGKPAMLVYTNDITRLKGEKVVHVVEEPVVVRERYVERPHGIHLPGIHINW